MKKYTSSTLIQAPITTITPSAVSYAHLESLKDMLNKGLLVGDVEYNGTVEVSNGNTTESFDYTFCWHEIESISSDSWHDAFLCEVQNDSRICVLK